jgi:hypothetical protein
VGKVWEAWKTDEAFDWRFAAITAGPPPPRCTHKSHTAAA